MSSPSVTVIDYGIGNLLNVVRALEHLGAHITIATTATEVHPLPDRMVLPGVGAFGDAMAELIRRGFDDIVRNFTHTQRPFLGICVGAQLLFDKSEEHGEYYGLGIIPGQVRKVPVTAPNGTRLRIPHVGWSPLHLPEGRSTWQNTPLASIEPGTSVYFVHSYMPVPSNPEHRLADTLYHDVRICAAVARDNVIGCQFHPERSGAAGLSIIQAFLNF